MGHASNMAGIEGTACRHGTKDSGLHVRHVLYGTDSLIQRSPVASSLKGIVSGLNNLNIFHLKSVCSHRCIVILHVDYKTHADIYIN